MQPTLMIALRAARAAAEKLKFNAEQKIALLQEGMNAEAILERGLSDAEHLVIKTIRNAHPGHNIEILQSGLNEARQPEADYLWRINLLSGVNNYQHSLPSVAVSVAYLFRGRTEHVAVINPFTEDTFTASRGRGMQCNEKRVRATAIKKLDQAMVGVNGFALTDDLFTSLTEQKAGIRLSGCPLLDLVHAASGRLDAALCQNVSEFDIQAAGLLAQESGALTGEINGKPISSKSNSMIIANQKLFKAIIQAL